MGLNLKKISGSDRASIYAVSPYEDIHIDEWAEFIYRLDELIPGEYTVDNTYITVTAQAETILALTFEMI